MAVRIFINLKIQIKTLFLGFWHGCPRCFSDEEGKQNGNHTTFEERYHKTLDKEKFLIDKGFNVETMWECDLRRMFSTDKKMTTFFKTTKIVGPLNPRDGFYGGRTGPLSLYFEPNENQRVDYVDVCRYFVFTRTFLRFGSKQLDFLVFILG